MIKRIGFALLAVAALVAVAAFINWGFHPSEWPPDGRFFFAIIAVSLAWGVYLWSEPDGR